MILPGNTKVLIVGETDGNDLSRLLAGSGCVLIEFAGRADGLRRAREGQPDLVILHRVDASPLAERLKAELAEPPAVVQVTAGGALSPAADAVLSWPVSGELLIATLAGQLRRLAVERELKEAVRARDDMISIAAHELRTPLTTLQLSLHFTRRQLADDQARALPHLDRAAAAAGRVALLLEDLLDVCQITAGRPRLRLESVELGEVVAEAAGRLDKQIEASGSELRLDLSGGVRGVWDRMRLDQIVTNLLSNAIKYGEGRPIEVSVAQQGGLASLVVRDHGSGIAPEQQARIFRRFERAGRERPDSYGLGLWIVKMLVEALEGEVRLVSAPGQGTSFTVTLPLRPSAAEPAAATSR